MSRKQPTPYRDARVVVFEWLDYLSKENPDQAPSLTKLQKLANLSRKTVAKYRIEWLEKKVGEVSTTL